MYLRCIYLPRLFDVYSYKSDFQTQTNMDGNHGIHGKTADYSRIVDREVAWMHGARDLYDFRHVISCFKFHWQAINLITLLKDVLYSAYGPLGLQVRSVHRRTTGAQYGDRRDITKIWNAGPQDRSCQIRTVNIRNHPFVNFVLYGRRAIRWPSRLYKNFKRRTAEPTQLTVTVNGHTIIR